MQHPDIVWMTNTLKLAGSDLDRYRKRIRQAPRLTVEDEQDLAVLVQRGRDAREFVDKLVSEYGELDSIPAFFAVEEFTKGVIAGEEARLRLIFHNLRFAFWAALVSLSKDAIWRPIREVRPRFRDHSNWGGQQIESLRRFAHDRLPLADRVQEANLALVQATNGYYPGSVKYASYVGKAVYNGLTAAILAERYRDGLRRSTAAAMNDTLRALMSLRRRTGHEPSLELIATDSNQGVKAVQFRLEEWAAMPRQTFEELYGEMDLADPDTDEVLHPGDLIWDPEAPNGDNYLALADRADAIDEVLKTLSEREAGVIRLRFGLVDNRPRTFDEIGQVYGVTRERIRQIESHAMSKLRHPSRSKVLRDHLDEGPEWSWYGTRAHDANDPAEVEYELESETKAQSKPSRPTRRLRPKRSEPITVTTRRDLYRVDENGQIPWTGGIAA